MNSSIAKRCAHIAIATLLAACLTVNHAWAAAPNEGARSVVVHYADLDLSRPKDVKTLYHRLKAAAWSVCNNLSVWNDDLAAFSEYHRCVHRAIENGVASVSSERLTELYARYNR